MQQVTRDRQISSIRNATYILSLVMFLGILVRTNKMKSSKICNICGQDKLLVKDLWGKNPSSPDGFRSQCKKCYNKKTRQRFRQKRLDPKYRELEARRRNTPANKHKKNIKNLQRLYGITETQFQDLMNRQKGTCAICSKDFSELKKRACVDHNHNTNLVRGLLCPTCNLLIEALQESKKNFFRAATYLEDTADNLTYEKQSYPLPNKVRLTNKSYYDKMAAISSTYNISETEYLNLIHTQNNKCAICSIPFDELSDRELCIDHNHETHAIRGLLCRNCNSALGYAKEDYRILFSSIMYLEQHKENTNGI